jgi:hypothetical protein
MTAGRAFHDTHRALTTTYTRARSRRSWWSCAAAAGEQKNERGQQRDRGDKHSAELIANTATPIPEPTLAPIRSVAYPAESTSAPKVSV